jgi:alanyl-tRNA synthetase
VLDNTPFYSESGGQVGDQGVLSAEGVQFGVDDTQKIKADVFGHHGTQTQGTLKVGDTVKAAVDWRAPRRDHAQPQRHPPDAQGAARSARRACDAKGLAGRCDKTRFDFTHGAA